MMALLSVVPAPAVAEGPAGGPTALAVLSAAKVEAAVRTSAGAAPARGAEIACTRAAVVAHRSAIRTGRWPVPGGLDTSNALSSNASLTWLCSPSCTPPAPCCASVPASCSRNRRPARAFRPTYVGRAADFALPCKSTA